MRELIEEEADAAVVFAGRDAELERPDDAAWPTWSGYVQAAFHELRDDRFYGAMGGLGRIYFASISDYADRYGIAGSDFDDLVTLLRAVDDEYVAFQNEQAKAEADKHKKT